MMPFTRWMAKTYLETEFQLSTAKVAVIAGEKNGGLFFFFFFKRETGPKTDPQEDNNKSCFACL